MNLQFEYYDQRNKLDLVDLFEFPNLAEVAMVFPNS